MEQKIKHDTLLGILESLRCEAPSNYKRYHISETTTRSHVYSLCYIHLYLKVRHGLVDFNQRENFITDGPGDGGVDAYYIDEESKKIYFIQSKYRDNHINFAKKEINVEDLAAMELDQILDGHKESHSGIKFNSKIINLQDKISQLNIAKYSYHIIILANCSLPNSKIKRIIGDVGAEKIEVFDYNAVTNNFIFPIVSGNYFHPSDVNVTLNFQERNTSRIRYDVSIGEIETVISVVFVPTIEIAKILNKYRNAILKYNPRCYLEMKSNKVNKEISFSIEHEKNNVFALYNNGITMLSTGVEFNDRTGKQSKAQMNLNNPQIINGGQTAFTLSRIYEKYSDNAEKLEEIFEGKEVLLKVISFDSNNNSYNKKQLKIIQDISRATNQQSKVDDADRRSNDFYQIELQEKIFSEYGFFYERKQGEFHDGINNNYINKELIIKRDDFIRSCHASRGLAGEARSEGKSSLFSEDLLKNYLVDISNEDLARYFFAYRIYTYLHQIEKQHKTLTDKKSTSKFGNALRYGKYAVISAYFYNHDKIKNNDIYDNYKEEILEILKEWHDFENYAKENKKNESIFSISGKLEANMLNYYKSKNVNTDIKYFFSESK
ncbi:AIPR family protein [Enterobacter hormaechei]|uniref:AIPR family protein n=1 Tax=Enterobacter hormaechei TaxID=158836 RepID=UPI001F3F49B4|nr:AIPR family protein [Enterobacter hormaechei]UJA59056.1 AIPR family protein [Enterobacter hormaechei]